MMFSLLVIGGHFENQDDHQLHTFIILQQAVPNAQRAFSYYSFVVNGTKKLGTTPSKRSETCKNLVRLSNL